METPNRVFSDAALDALDDDPVSQLAEKLEREVTEKAADRTPKGRKSKTAKEAEQESEMRELLASTLASVNGLLAARWPELEHSPEEIRNYSLFGGRVLAKYVDMAMLEYGPEIVLLTYAAGATGPKIHRLIQNRRDHGTTKAPDAAA